MSLSCFGQFDLCFTLYDVFWVITGWSCFRNTKKFWIKTIKLLWFCFFKLRIKNNIVKQVKEVTLTEGLLCNVAVFYDYLTMWSAKSIHFTCNDEKLMYATERFSGRMGLRSALRWYKSVFFFKCNDMSFNMHCTLKVTKHASDKTYRTKTRRIKNGNAYIY